MTAANNACEDAACEKNVRLKNTCMGEWHFMLEWFELIAVEKSQCIQIRQWESKNRALKELQFLEETKIELVKRTPVSGPNVFDYYSSSILVSV